MSQPTIRSMTQSDLTAVAALERVLSPHPWEVSFFADSLRQHSCWVLSDQNVCLGFLVFSQVADQAELLNIGVATDYQGRGYGRGLVRFCIEQCRGRATMLFLEVRASNETALALYQDEGFCEAGMRRDYYITARGREDAIVMALDLTLI